MNQEMITEKSPVLFRGKTIQRIFHKGEWWFAVSDIVSVLSESANVSQYIKKMRARDKELDSYWGTNCTPLDMISKDGKRRKMMLANRMVLC